MPPRSSSALLADRVWSLRDHGVTRGEGVLENKRREPQLGGRWAKGRELHRQGKLSCLAIEWQAVVMNGRGRFPARPPACLAG